MRGNVGVSGLYCKASVHFEVRFPVPVLFCQVFWAFTQIPRHVTVQNSVIRILVAFNLKSMSYVQLSIFYRSNPLFPLAGVVKVLSYK